MAILPQIRPARHVPVSAKHVDAASKPSSPTQQKSFFRRHSSKGGAVVPVHTATAEVEQLKRQIRKTIKEKYIRFNVFIMSHETTPPVAIPREINSIGQRTTRVGGHMIPMTRRMHKASKVRQAKRHLETIDEE